MEFVWNKIKEEQNIRKHNVSFLEAVETFSDPQGIRLFDIKHSTKESRYFWIGKTKNDRILTTRFTIRGKKSGLLEVLSGANLKRSTMKHPKLNELKLDAAGTKLIRKKMKQTKKIKITINLDEDILEKIKYNASNNGAPYQTYLNHLLRDHLNKKSNEASRISKIEREIASIKKQIAL